MKEIRSFILQNANALEDFFIQTESLAVIILDKDLIIMNHNKYFGELIASGNDVSGNSIQSFLLSESTTLLPSSDSNNVQSIKLNFKPSDNSPFFLQCYLFRMEDGKQLILGGHLMLTGDQMLQKMTIMANEMANMTRDLIRKNKELEEARSKIKTLSGIVPICMHCKEIRDDQGYWNQLEKYITEHSEAQLSHGICDKCLAEYYPEDVKNK